MKRPKILVTRQVPAPALTLLKRHFTVDHYDRDTAIPRKMLLERIKDKEGLLCILTDKVNPELLAAAPRLKTVSTFSVGFDHIDVPACTKAGVTVTNTPGVLTETTADFTWALLLAAARRVVEGDGIMRRRAYECWDPLMLLGADVHGKTLGILGFGRIGQAVARRAQGFGMTILYNDVKRLPRKIEKSLNARFVPFKQVLKRSDFVSVHTVLDKKTRHLIDAKAMKAMKPTAILVNAARGPIVDEKALVRALRKGVIAGAGLDVYEWEPKTAPGLIGLKNVVLAPHLASASIETRTKMGLMAAFGLVDTLVRRRRPEFLVNPKVYS